MPESYTHTTLSARCGWPYAYVWSPDGTGAAQLDNIVDVIDSTINGDTASAWGTPVICRTDGGDIIAWSDSLIGIKARVRVLGDPLGSPEWWRSPAAYTDTIHVSALQTNRFGMAGSFPSVPTFAHIVSRDSNCAIVWEQPMAGTHAAPYPCDIYYKRLQHTQGSTGDTLIALDSSLAVVSNGGFGPHRHPSISQHQDAWRAVHDAITWEQPSPTNPQSGMLIHMRSLWTETRTFNATDQPDVILPKPNLCGWTHVLVSNPGGKWLYPNICSINPRDSSDQIKAQSSIAFNLPFEAGGDTTNDNMAEVSIQFFSETMKSMRQFRFGGRFVNNSETMYSQKTRHAVLYETTADTHKLRTTREFFLGKVRPYGYMADGRQLMMRLNDSTAAGISFHMIDAWSATDSTAHPLLMKSRDTTLRQVMTLPDAISLLKTNSVYASDSTAIGIRLEASFDGDTTGYGGTYATIVVELIDSATGLREDRLDSFPISPTQRTHVVDVSRDLDLLLGRYFIRATVDTVNVHVPTTSRDSRYPVAETAMYVDDSGGAAKIRRLPSAQRANMRVVAFPNPTANSSEVHFSVAEASRVRAVLSNIDGSYSVKLVDDWLEPGRYAIDVDCTGLPPGAYLVRINGGTLAGTAKIVVSER